MQYFLLKSEPDVFGWDDLVTKGVSMWDGVRNYTARNLLRTMQPGDLGLFYHSNIGKECVGVLRVVKAAYTDPTAGEDLRWSAVDVEPVCKLTRAVTLAELKVAHEAGGPLGNLRMFRENRLSVIDLTADEWREILRLSATPDPTPA